MSIAALSYQIRLSLEDPANVVRREQLGGAVDDFVKAPLDEPGVVLFQLQKELQTIHGDVVDHTSLGRAEIFLGVLYGLRSLLSFDFHYLGLLPTVSVNHAKELIISAATHADEQHPDKASEFRGRLLELYFLDTSVGGDVLEWVELDQKQKDKKSQWKSNLEDVLVTLGLLCPRELMGEVHSAFATPSSRVQLIILLNSLVSDQAFPSLAAKVADHPQIDSLLNSLLFDNSSTSCTIGLTVMVKLLPIFAVHAHQELKKMLPRLFVVLARIMCWREHAPSALPSLDQVGEPTGPNESGSDEFVETPQLELRPELGWQRLELTTKAGPPAPSSDTYFSFLYYLFPCNLIQFLRGPAAYLHERGYQTPFTVSWEDALDQTNIRSKAEALLRSRIVHSGVVRRDWQTELDEDGSWADYGVSRIASECMMLDAYKMAFGSCEGHSTTRKVEPPFMIIVNEEEVSGTPTPHPDRLALSSSKLRLSLQDMITTSVALKSNREVDIGDPMTAKWPSLLFTPSGDSPSKTNVDLPSEPGNTCDSSQLSGRVGEVVAQLQREVLLLRNELNFELWLSRQNVQHIGRLHQDRVLSKNAEVERQGLCNKLRQYKAQVQSLEREIREHKEQSSSAKTKYADWNNELQKKLRELREEKKRWVSEEAALRTTNKENLALFDAQKKLLADAEKEVFELKTRQKENQHKIDRLHDYERQIEQHVRMQKLWDADFERFNARGREIEQMKAICKQMEMMLESCEKSLEKMEEEARAYRRQNQALEGRLALLHKKYDAYRRLPESEITAIVAEKSDLALANAKLREENAELKDEMEEMRAAVEGLRAQLSGQRGLIYEPRPRPTVTS
ncbi:Hamartin protein-domain-containing protein [Pisolithus sp. B1]|nr:Hamartin protein-domain-containing protein [Pisolithus sp. B1]